jgi:hypothetical protein
MPSTNQDISRKNNEDFSRQDYLWAGLIFIAALALRLLRAGDGLPYMHFWDEPALAFKALDMLKTGDLNPHSFNYGSLMMYFNLAVDWVYTRFLLALPAGAPQALDNLAHLEYGSATGFDWYISHPSIIFWNRAFTALLGTATVLIVYALGKKASGLITAICGAVLLAALGIHIEHSAYVTTDVPMTFFVWLSAWFSLLYYKRQQPKWLLLGLAAGGLATSVKYNGALCLLIPLLSFLMSLQLGGYRRWLWAALPLVPLLAFSLGSPYALLDWQDFIQDALYEAQHYAEMRVSFHRNFLVFYPAICLVFGMGVLWIWQFLRGMDKSYSRWAAAGFLILVSAFLVFKASRSAWAEWQVWHTAETRTQAVQYINQLLGEDGYKQVGIAQELRIHPLDLEQIKGDVTIKSYVELLQHADDYDLIVGFGRPQGSNSRQRQEAEALREITGQIPPERLTLIGQGPLYLDILSVNPQVSIISETQGLSELIDFQ